MLSSNSSGKIFSTHCSFLSLDDDIITLFLEWIFPFLAKSNNFLGYYRVFEGKLTLVNYKGGYITYRII
jgi:hypothetical protein